MFKRRPHLPSALLALALALAAAQAARAQGTPASTKSDAAQVAQTGGAQDKSAGGRQSQQGTQTGGASQQPTTGLPAPLTAEQKISRSFRSAFLRPTPYIMSAFTAGITQLREDSQPQKDNADEAADWGSRAARNFATRTTTTVFASGFYPALFKQDPRYERSRSKKFMPRAAHAISRIFVTRDDDGNLEPNYSRFAGTFTASALANVWERSTPGHDRIGTDATFKRFGRSFISGAISNIFFREFGPDIIGIFRH
jgi:hypothetical protein